MKLLDQVRQLLRTKHYSYRTEKCYLRWIEQYIRFHRTADGFRHPATMGAAEVECFLTHLATQRHVSISTQTQAFSALLFLYRNVLRLELGSLDAVRARRSRRLPVVLSKEEVVRVLDAVDRLPTAEPYGLMARLMYGAGLRLMECCRLRVKDVDFPRNQLIIRQGKGDKDRVVMLPRAVRTALEEQVRARAALHQRDLGRGLGRVAMPDAPLGGCMRRFRRFSLPRSAWQRAAWDALRPEPAQGLTLLPADEGATQSVAAPRSHAERGNEKDSSKSGTVVARATLPLMTDVTLPPH
jgi:integrase